MATFTWDIDPTIFKIGFFQLRWYSLLFASGLLIGYKIILNWFIAENKDQNIVESLFNHIFVGTVLGARLGHVLFYDPTYYFSNPLEILMVWKGGLASHGGYIGIFIATIIFCRKHSGVSLFWLMDRIAVVSVFAGAMIRIGNFFNSEILGRAHEGFLSVIFSRVDQIPRHPTQLYEALGYSTIALIGYLYYKKSQRHIYEGRLMGIMMLLAFAFRFSIEFLKENQELFENSLALNMGQYLSIPAMLVGLFLISGKHHNIGLFYSMISPDHFGGGYTKEKIAVTPKTKKRKKKKKT